MFTDKKVIYEPRRKRAPDRSNKTPIPSSPVNRLFGELLRQFASDLPKPERTPPEGISSTDWNTTVNGRGVSGRKNVSRVSGRRTGNSEKAHPRLPPMQRLPSVSNPRIPDKWPSDYSGARILR